LTETEKVRKDLYIILPNCTSKVL